METGMGRHSSPSHLLSRLSSSKSHVASWASVAHLDNNLIHEWGTVRRDPNSDS